MKQLDGLARQAIVVGEDVRGQRFEAGVAHIHELLVVRAIHVCLVRTHLQCAAHHGHDCGKPGVVTVEFTVPLERVAGFVHADALNGQRRVSSGHAELDVAPGLPPQRLMAGVVAAVSDEGVADAVEKLADHVVAVALVTHKIARVAR